MIAKVACSEENQWDQSAIIRQTLMHESRDRGYALCSGEDDDRAMAVLAPQCWCKTELTLSSREGRILCDIYGSADVPFNDHQGEGRSSEARLEEAWI
jgi:hypothetical protein